MLRPFLLLLIHRRPSHGYDLIERLAAMGVEDVEPGHAYRVLRALERERLLSSRWVPSDAGPARRRYELTAEGLAELRARMSGLARFGAVLDAFLVLWTQEPEASAPPAALESVSAESVSAESLSAPAERTVPAERP